MTDEDRALLKSLTDGCDKFCLNLAGSRLSQEDQVEMALMFIDVAQRVLRRAFDHVVVIEDVAS